MQLFRRFRFQPTRAESELAMLRPLYGALNKISIKEKSPLVAAEYEVAEKVYRQMLKSLEGNHNQSQPSMLVGLNNLGVILSLYRKFSEAEKVFSRILDEVGGSLPREDDLFSRTFNNLAIIKLHQAKYLEAELLLRQAIYGKEQDPDDWEGHHVWVCGNLAVTLSLQDKAREARDIQERVIEKAGNWYGIGDPIFDSLQKNLNWIKR